MPKVKISHDDHAMFTEAAASAGLTVGDWLAATARKHATVAPDRLWSDVMAWLSHVIASDQQRAYLGRARIDTIVGNTVIIAVPDSYTRDIIETRLRAVIAQTLADHLRRPVQIAVIID
ncbi:hypothetical protein AB0G04_25360 [Actinoplanes sp. NPDC023801]|uniref:hypothetical protein n=1 Tax=Actinoplanes sp. NPDC023801 TaxID=3154595 RepID=UPI00340DD0A1